jgi:hypothetical protein
MVYDPRKSFFENVVRKTVVRLAVDSTPLRFNPILRTTAVVLLERFMNEGRAVDQIVEQVNNSDSD